MAKKLVFNPLLKKGFQNESREDLAETLVIGNITGGTDIELSGIGINADTINGAGTTNVINLNEPFAGGWSVSSDDAAYGQSWVYGDSTFASLGYGIVGSVNTGNGGTDLTNTGGSMIGEPYAYIGVTRIGIGDTGAVPSINIPIFIKTNVSIPIAIINIIQKGQLDNTA